MQTSQTSRVTEWVRLCEHWCEPDWTHWCDGSPKDRVRLLQTTGDSVSLNKSFGDTPCVTPTEAITEIALHCRGVLRGRMMYVVPYVLAGDDLGLLVTDCAARAAQICRRARVGTAALSRLSDGEEFAAELYVTGDEESGSRAPLSVRCHLSGPPITDTACRTGNRRKRELPMESAPVIPLQTTESTCGDCASLCPNRATAIASTIAAASH